jgi:hypothetical protein
MKPLEQYDLLIARRDRIPLATGADRAAPVFLAGRLLSL